MNGPSVSLRKLIGIVALVGVAAGLFWRLVGRDARENYLQYRRDLRAIEDTTPVGYVGIHYRRSYNARPAHFVTEEGGRTLLWAAMDESGKPTIHYDVTGARFDPRRDLSGGFGRDSIPGIDHPVFEPGDSDRVRDLPPSLPVFGLELDSGPRAYPRGLLLKIEVVNDQDGDEPLAVVLDRGLDRAFCYSRRLDGRAITLGTSGYSAGHRPMLYDRKTRSLWLPSPDALECVGGPLLGRTLPLVKEPPLTTWGDWRRRFPRAPFLLGNDRSQPIPAE